MLPTKPAVVGDFGKFYIDEKKEQKQDASGIDHSHIKEEQDFSLKLKKDDIADYLNRENQFVNINNAEKIRTILQTEMKIWYILLMA